MNGFAEAIAGVSSAEEANPRTTNSHNECPSLSEFQSTPEEDRAPRSIETWYPTESQQRGLAKLHQLADVFSKTGEMKFAGFRPACHRALVIGGSGSGKTNLVNRFAAERGIPITAIDCGSFIVAGASTKPSTLGVVRDFVRSCRPSRDGGPALEGVMFFDEICKLVPSEGLSQNGWSLSVAAEAIALLSADTRLAAHDWSPTDIRRLRNNIMIVGGGAFQSALIEVRAANQRGDLGFGHLSDSKATHSSQISKYLPEEILSRFSSDIVVLESPTRHDFEQAITRIHSQLGVRRQALVTDLVDEAIKGIGGMRWVENYLCRLLFEHPYAIRTRGKNNGDVRDAEPRTFDLMLADIPQCQRDANDTATKLRTKLAMVYSRLQSISNQGERLPQSGVLCNPRFGQALVEAIRCCRLTGEVSTSDQDSKALSQWRALAWQALGESSSDLEAHHLTEMWVEAWSLAGALIDLRQKLSQAVQRGLLG
jgi:hypothetical protein